MIADNAAVMLRFLLLACVLGLIAAGAAATSIRGLDPARASFYQPVDGKFRCLDGKKSVPFSQVNDDYCDCFDGSDEPGTSACSNGKFYCANRGAVPHTLNSSMVDDGVCDCCDGSDERPGACKNRCREEGSRLLDSLRQQVAAAEAGVQTKAKYQKDAVASKKGWQKRKGEVEAALEAERPKRDSIEAEKKKLEDEQARLQARKGKLEEQHKASQPPAPPAAEGNSADSLQLGEQQAEAGAGAEQEQEHGEMTAEEIALAEAEAEAAEQQALAEGAAAFEEEGGAEVGDADDDGTAAAAAVDGTNDGKTTEQLAQEAMEAELKKADEERRAQEVMAQWVPGSKKSGELESPQEQQQQGAEADAAAAAAAAVEPGEQQQQFFPQQGGSAGAAGSSGDAGAAPEGAPEAAAAAEEGPQPEKGLVGKAKALMYKLLGLQPTGSGAAAELAAVERQLAALEKRLAAVRSRHGDAATKVRQLESEAAELSTKLGHEYGEADVFVALADRCLEAKVDKYTYEVCPFKSAAQKEGAASTSLGSWAGFEDNHTVMSFTNGAHCWQGPSRSMTVTLKCGQAEELMKVQEPSRCEYTAELATPAACSPDELRSLQQDLAAKEALLEAVGHDEL